MRMTLAALLVLAAQACAADAHRPDCRDDSGLVSAAGGSECVARAPGSAPSGPDPEPEAQSPYDLSGFDIPFPVTWPKLQTPTREINVSTLAGFRSAVRRSRVRIVVAAGAYDGNINITGNNIEILMSNDATLNGRVSMAPGQRGLHWVGGNVNMGTSGVPGAVGIEPWRDVSDHLFDDIQWFGSVSYHTHRRGNGNHRIAWVNSTVDHTATAEEFCFHTIGSVRHSDFILANVRMEADHPQAHSTTRLQNIDRVVIVDSSFNMGIGIGGSPGPEPGSTGNRGGVQLVDYYMANSIVGGRQHFTSVGGKPPFAVRNAVFDNVTRYVHAESNGGAFINNDSGGANSGTVNNSQQYSTAPRAIGRPPHIAPMTGRNPPIIKWDGVTLPDVSGYGAQR